MSDDEQIRAALDNRPNALTRIKVPLWLLLVIVGVLVVLFVFLFTGKDSVDLGPAVRGAESVQACVQLRTPDLNPVEGEDRMEQALRELGAGRADVRVQRPPDTCPPIFPASAQQTTTTRR